MKRSTLIILIFSIFVLVTAVLHEKNYIRYFFPEQKNSRYLESFFRNRDDYEEVVSKSRSTEKVQVFAGIISHHFLARDMIARFFSGIDSKYVKRIVIVGPDHFSKLQKGNYKAVTTFMPWNTPYGFLSSDKTFNGDKVSTNAIPVIDEIFLNEHSIYTLVPFIKYYFPDSKIFPLVLSSSSDYNFYYNLGKNFYDKDTLLIISSDFSHNVTVQEAATNDTQSIEALSHTSLDTIGKIECDCKPCMAFLYGFLSNVDSNFELVDNKNSSFYSSDELNINNVTSYVSAYYLDILGTAKDY